MVRAECTAKKTTEEIKLSIKIVQKKAEEEKTRTDEENGKEIRIIATMSLVALEVSRQGKGLSRHSCREDTETDATMGPGAAQSDPWHHVTTARAAAAQPRS